MFYQRSVLGTSREVSEDRWYCNENSRCVCVYDVCVCACFGAYVLALLIDIVKSHWWSGGGWWLISTPSFGWCPDAHITPLTSPPILVPMCSFAIATNTFACPHSKWPVLCCLGVTRKTRIIDVIYNASNNELVRTKTLVKSCIVQIDSTPFRQWYEAHYATPLGRKKGVKLVSVEW